MIFNANKRTLLFSSAGRRVDLIKRFRRASLELGIDTRLLGIDCDPTAPASKYVDRFFEVPKVDDPAFPDAIKEILEEESVTDLFPLIHPEIPFWADHKKRNPDTGTRIWVGSPEFVELARDKQATKQWLSNHGFSVPALVEPDDAGSPVQQKVVIKPRYGCQSLGIRFLDTLDYWPQLDYNSDEWVVEEYVEGKEFTIDVFTDYEGEFLAAVPRERIKIRGGEVVKAKTVDDSQLTDTIYSVWEKLMQENMGISGPFCIQGIRTKNGEFKFTEINARFGGGVPLSLQAGVHYPHILLSGKQRDAWKRWTPGVIMHRFDEAMYHRG